MNDATQIANLTFQGGNAGAANGGGIFLSAGAQPLFQHIHVVANFAQSGGGIYASSPITLVNSDINNNAATNGSGGGVYAAGSIVAMDSVIQNNTVITNGYGGGMLTTAAFTGTNVSFIDNTVNNGYDGGGLYVSGAVKLIGRAIRQQPDHEVERLRRRRRRDGLWPFRNFRHAVQRQFFFRLGRRRVPGLLCKQLRRAC